MMMVCEHKAHSWSVSCPSFFFFLLLLSTLPASSLHLYTYSLPPPVAHSYSHLFFYSHRRARKLPGEAQKRACFFLSFLSSFSSLSLALFLSPSLCFAMRPYGRIRRRASLLLPFFRVKQKKTEDKDGMSA